MPDSTINFKDLVEAFNSYEPKSKTNEIELQKVSQELNFKNIRFFIAPDKDVSKEGVVEDVLFLFKNIQDKNSTAIKLEFTSEDLTLCTL